MAWLGIVAVIGLALCGLWALRDALGARLDRGRSSESSRWTRTSTASVRLARLVVLVLGATVIAGAALLVVMASRG